MPQPAANTPKTASSPKGVARVDEGKVKKPKVLYRNEIPAIQQINGKTYACESCKRGHRVHKCDHGKTRPISETNQPGRPSAGQKRGCHCPRNCACTTKSCKCDRNCACTQEMFLIVRLDNPAIITRESTSTPKPVWEDAEGNPLTLKKVWADGNGKEIDDAEYEARKRLKQEREEAAREVPSSSCCGSKKLKEEPDSPKGGCRHRQNVAAIQPHPGPTLPDLTPQSSAAEPWMSTCSCGSGCSCLYCPDHPNNATSISHAQQQVKNLAEQAYTGHGLTPGPSHPESISKSCMGGQPSFLLSTSDVSHHQLQQFFSDTLNPNAIYLSYPIQRHSWTNSPLSTHCSQVHSPTRIVNASPEKLPAITESFSTMSTPMPLPNDIVWDFSGNELGERSFGWLGLDASYGTDYNIGQATVASMSNSTPLATLQAPVPHQGPMLDNVIHTLAEPPLPDQYAMNSLPELDSNVFVDFDNPALLENLASTTFRQPPIPTLHVQPAQSSCCSTSWPDLDLPLDHHLDHEFAMAGISSTSSPIMNHL